MSYLTISNDPRSRSTVTEPWVYWDDAFTPEEIDKIVAYCEANGEVKKAEIMGTDAPVEAEKVRRSDIAWFRKNPETAWIFDRINFILMSVNEMFYGFDLNGYDAFQFTSYDSSYAGQYDWHMDVHLSTPNKPIAPEQTRKLSMTLCLNDEFEGGDFLVNEGNQNYAKPVPIKKGRAILFPSFMCHKVTPVTTGTRKSLVVWCQGPKFR